MNRTQKNRQPPVSVLKDVYTSSDDCTRCSTARKAAGTEEFRVQPFLWNPEGLQLLQDIRHELLWPAYEVMSLLIKEQVCILVQLVQVHASRELVIHAFDRTGSWILVEYC